ncbi:MAG: energy-coupling factor ABC transporter permease [Gammaproteobacteria bacterium]
MPAYLIWQSYLLAGFCLLVAAWRAPWRKLAVSRFQHVFLGACVATLVLWCVRANVAPGLDIHFLGVTTLTLMFGWPLALAALAAVCLGVGLAGVQDWRALGLSYVTQAVVPAALSWLVYRWADARLPRHVFIYLFICVFLGAALAMAAASLGLGLILTGARVEGVDRVFQEYFGLLPLIAFPEGVMNGFVMTGLVALRPGWLCTFDDARYIKGK